MLWPPRPALALVRYEPDLVPSYVRLHRSPLDLDNFIAFALRSQEVPLQGRGLDCSVTCEVVREGSPVAGELGCSDVSGQGLQRRLHSGLTRASNTLLPLKEVTRSTVDLGRLTAELLERGEADAASRLSRAVEVLSRPASTGLHMHGKPDMRCHSSHLLGSGHIADLLRWGVIKRISQLSVKMLSVAFLVEKSDGMFSRFILSCKRPNEAPVPPDHLKLTDPLAFLQWLSRPGYNVALQADMKGWFFQLSISDEVGTYFAFKWRSQVFVLQRLPQGWKWAPFLAQLVAECLLLAAGIQSANSLVWIDNIIMLAGSSEEALALRSAFQALAERVGAVIGTLDDEPSFRFTALGRTFDLRTKTLSLSADWASKAAAVLSQVLDSQSPLDLHTLQVVIGISGWALYAMTVPLAHIAPLARLLSVTCKEHLLSVQLSPFVRRLLRDVLTYLEDFKEGRTSRWLTPGPSGGHSVIIYTDASTVGGGLVVLDSRGSLLLQTSFPWAYTIESRFIAAAEALAVYLGILTCLEAQLPLQDAAIRLKVDNEALFHSIKSGFSSYAPFAAVLLHLQHFFTNRITCSRLYVAHVPSEEQLADCASRLSRLQSPIPLPPSTWESGVPSLLGQTYGNTVLDKSKLPLLPPHFPFAGVDLSSRSHGGH